MKCSKFRFRDLEVRISLRFYRRVTKFRLTVVYYIVKKSKVERKIWKTGLPVGGTKLKTLSILVLGFGT